MPEPAAPLGSARPAPPAITPGQDREARIRRFLQQAGWGAAARRPLAGDASARRYERLRLGERRAVLMDAPPPLLDVRPFLRVGELLRALGCSVPAVYAGEVEAGLLLLEDFGDDTGTRLLAAGAEEEAVYAAAIDTLIHLHRCVTPTDLEQVPVWDEDRALAEVGRLLDWYWPAIFGAAVPAAAAAAYEAAWRAVLPHRNGVPLTLALFDYHLDNIVRLPERAGVAGCGLLDFQDAVAAALPFDLVSLLQDARRDVAPGLAAAMRARYLAAYPDVDRAAFDTAYFVIGAQRSARIIGTFARLAVRDRKPAYLVHLPRVWRLLDADLQEPALAALKDWFDRYLPPEHRRNPEPAR